MIIAWDKNSNSAIKPIREALIGELGKFPSGTIKHVPAEADINIQKERDERQWRNDELLRTDGLVDLSDYPRSRTKEEFKAYRDAVAKWDSNPNFPNRDLRPIWKDKINE